MLSMGKIKPDKRIEGSIPDIMEGARDVPRKAAARAPTRGTRKDRMALDPAVLASKISALEKKMYAHARELEFEQAAKIRDQLEELRREGFGLPGTAAN